VNDLLTASSPEIMKLALEYSQLAALPSMSEQQANRLGELLAIASDSIILSFWISEIDHTIGHHLGLLDDASRHTYRSQQALLREHLGEEQLSPNPISDELKQHRSVLTPQFDCTDDQHMLCP
jgi:hypothetical protein